MICVCIRCFRVIFCGVLAVKTGTKRPQKCCDVGECHVIQHQLLMNKLIDSAQPLLEQCQRLSKIVMFWYSSDAQFVHLVVGGELRVQLIAR